MTKKFLPITLICSFLMLSVIGCTIPQQALNNQEQEEEKAIPIISQEVVTKEIHKEFTYVSKLQPGNETMVISNVSGKVEQVNYDLGDTVNAGDVLFTINGTSTQQQIVSLEQQLNMAKLTLNDATKSYNDTKALYDIGAASEQQYLQVKSAYDQAKISYNSAAENYNIVLNDLNKQNVNLSGGSIISIKSPANGVITNRNIEVGDMFSAGVIPFSIANIDTLLIEVGVSEQIVTKIAEGEEVTVVVSSISEEPFKGVITAISPAADLQTGSFTVKIEVDNTNSQYRAGMIANITFKVDGKEDAIVVPIDSILSDGEKQYCYIVEEDRAKQVEVTTGIDNGIEMEITNGLNKGDRLIIKGQNYVNDTSLVIEEDQLQAE